MGKTASISQAKNKLSELIRGLESGPVTILDRGRPVAHLVALPPLDTKRARLVSKGLVSPARTPFSADKLLALPLRKMPEGMSLLEAVLKEREEGW
ncbi:MAG: type II toxin-antitoxin system Phd/YefM family antitoxin [Terriglobales bacterium]